jgi:hemolysin-activating ACP:hemolysin acyltransferase
MELRSLNRVYSKSVSDDQAIVSAIKLARVARLSWYCKTEDFCRLIVGASANGKLQLLFDEDQKPVAFYLWANLAETTIIRLLNNERLTIEPYEWNESTRSTIILCCSLPARLRGIISHARDEIFKNESSVYLVRKKRGKSCASQFFLSPARERWVQSLPAQDGSCRCGQIGCKQI